MSHSTVGDARSRARALFDGAEFEACLDVALSALDDAPDDVELLVLAGRAGTEVQAEGVIDQLRRATELAPDDAVPWHFLGEALAADGATSEADAAFRRAVELDPDDQGALTHLGHTALATGRREEGIGYLSRAADIAHTVSTASMSLVIMYRSFGQYEEALAHARKVAEGAPDDALAWLDVAELSLQVDQLDEASDAFSRLREVDDVPGNEAFPLYGLMLVEIRRGRWEACEDLVAQAAAIDPQGISADVASFLHQRTARAEEGQSPPPDQGEVERALRASLADYQRMLADGRQPGGDLVG